MYITLTTNRQSEREVAPLSSHLTQELQLMYITLTTNRQSEREVAPLSSHLTQELQLMYITLTTNRQSEREVAPPLLSSNIGATANVYNINH